MMANHFVCLSLIVLLHIIGSITAQSIKKIVSIDPPKSQSSTTLGATVCTVRIRDLPDKQPIFINEDRRSLMMPLDGNLTWSRGAKSWVACASGKNDDNVFKGKTSSLYQIECIDGQLFRMDGKDVDIRSVKCSYKVTGHALNSPTKDPECPATLKSIGFAVPSDLSVTFYDLYYSCFNESDSSVLYTRFNLYGREISNKSITSEYIPSFASAGFTSRIPITTTYTYVNQLSALKELFRQKVSEDQAINDVRFYYRQSYLQKASLIPKDDQIFASWQWSTYYYINVVGMWNDIKTGNWKLLENDIRSYANKTGLFLEIYSGTFGTLELCTSNKFCPPFTLENGKVPVPKWIWKIVISPNTNQAVAFVISNNPFNKEKPLCTGDHFGWRGRYDQFSKAQLHVCTVQKLTSITGLPQRNMNSFGILTKI